MNRARRWLIGRPWWRWQTGVVCGVMLLGVAAVGGWVNGLIDEIGDQRSSDALNLELDRTRFEQECRFDVSRRVDEIDSQILDVFVALIQAGDDVNLQQEAVASLDYLRTEKIDAVSDRAAAVDVCRRRAGELYGPR